MSPSTQGVLLSVLGLVLQQQHQQHVQGHPQCLDFSYPAEQPLSYCTFVDGEPGGSCCDEEEDRIIEENAVSGLSDDCQAYYAQVECGECHPWTLHLFERGTFALKREWCEEYMEACSSRDLEALGIASASDYCDEHSEPADMPDLYYSYPFNATSDVDVAFAVDIFPNLTSEARPNSVLDAVYHPSKEAWWLVSQSGEITEVEHSPTVSNSTLVANISMLENFLVGGEQGLLGLAFAPDFNETGMFFISYSLIDYTLPQETKYNNARNNQISRLQYREADPVATLATERKMIHIPQFAANHNGGSLLFKPAETLSSSASSDGDDDDEDHAYDLYISSGDGGSGNDPEGNSQDPFSLNGKILRLRVSTNVSASDSELYSIPPSNPYAGRPEQGREEVWAWGLRNPWRCSFDRLTGDYVCGDVGQGRVEAVRVVTGGSNHGWPTFEGTMCNVEYSTPENCSDFLDQVDVVWPKFEYCHPGISYCEDQSVLGLSITGGHVYRGSKYAEEYGGHYFFADYGADNIFVLLDARNESWTVVESWGGADTPKQTTVAQARDGEMYMVSFQEVENVDSESEGFRMYELPCPYASCDEGLVEEDEVEEITPSPATSSRDGESDGEDEDGSTPTPGGGGGSDGGAPSPGGGGEGSGGTAPTPSPAGSDGASGGTASPSVLPDGTTRSDTSAAGRGAVPSAGVSLVATGLFLCVALVARLP